MVKAPQRGDEQRDADGTVWVVLLVHGENGPHYSRVSRVRKHSLAYRIIFEGARQ